MGAFFCLLLIGGLLGVLQLFRVKEPGPGCVKCGAPTEIDNWYCDGCKNTVERQDEDPL